MRRSPLVVGGAVLILCLAAATPVAGQDVISVLAGTGTPGLSGDGGKATAARLRAPLGLATDGAGNVFIADTENHRVRRVDPFGVITTIAGKGTAGFCGDGGPATNACLNSPVGLAIDGAGNLYVADRENHRVRKVDGGGTITTFAGTGAIGFCGEHVPAATACLNRLSGLAVDNAGNLYISDNTRIRKVDPAGFITTIAGQPEHGFCGDNGPAVNGCLSGAEGIAVDALGNVFFADYNNWRIRKIAISGVITTVAGQGVPGFCGDGGPATGACLAPFGVAVGAAGDIFIGDTWTQRLRRVDPGGTITTMAGTATPPALCGAIGPIGPATSACLRTPTAVAVDEGGTVFVTESDRHTVRQLDAGAVLTAKRLVTGGCQHLVLRVYLAMAAPAGGIDYTLSSPNGHVSLPHGPLHIKPGKAASIFSLDTMAVADREGVTIVATFVDNPLAPWMPHGLARTLRLTLNPIQPWSVAVGPNPVTGGEPSAGLVTLECNAAPGDITVSLSAASPASLPAASVVVPRGETIARFVVTTSPVSKTRKASIGARTEGGVETTRLVVNPAQPIPDAPWVGTAAGGAPRAVCCLVDENFSGDGGPATIANLSGPRGVTVDPLGQLLIADTENRRIRKVDAAGVITTIAGNGTHHLCGDDGPATAACLVNPTDVAADALGNVFIADGDRIRRITAAGIISTVAIPYPGNTVGGLAIDPAGDVLAAIPSANRIVKYSAVNGTSTVAGNGTRAFCGDSGLAPSACLAFPSNVAVDAAGNVFVADQANFRIRKINTSGVITTVAGSGGSSFCPYSGDGGPATAACIAYPPAIAVDAEGRLFIAVFAGGGSNNELRVVSETGTITTLGGFPGFCGAFDEACFFNDVHDLALDGAGHLFVADTANHRIRKVYIDAGP